LRESGVKKTAPGCPISDRWGIGIHFASNRKLGNFGQVDFFTSSCPASPGAPQGAPAFERKCRVGHALDRKDDSGWLIDKLKLSDPLHRTFAYADAGIGAGYVESILRKRQDQERHESGH
jgi:hypothetical protein